MKLNNNYQDYWKSIGLLFPLLLTGCSDELQLYPDDTGIDGRLVMELGANINQVSSTRADDSGFADGDRMGVFVVSYENGLPGTLTTSTNLASNVMFQFNADMGKWDSSTNIYWPDAETPVDAYGYYPFDNALSNVNEYSFEVAKDQSETSDDGEMSAYEASDFLWAKATNAQPGKMINLLYGHKMSGVKVILEEGSGFAAGEFAQIAKVVTVDNTLRHSNIDFATGTVTPTGDFDYNIVANPESDSFRAIVVPQTVADGKTTIGISLDDVNYSYKKEGGMTYASGKLNKFTLRVDKKSESGKYEVTLTSESISDWETDTSSHDFEANSYVVVECPEAGKLKETLVSNGIDYLTVKNLKIKGVLNHKDCDLMRSEMPSLTSLNLKEVNFPYVVIGFDWDKMTDIYGENALPAGAFYGNKTIRRFVLPESIVEIGENAFRETETTSAIVIPESVRKIDDEAFAYIWEISEIILPGKMEYIGSGAFRTAAKFEMRLPSTLRYIGDEAFAGAGNAYGTFSIPSNLEYLGHNAFHGTGHDMTGDVLIPAGLLTRLCMEIGFANGTNITLPEGLKSIDRLAGKFNSPIILPKSLEKIEQQAFYCTRFSSPIIFPENLVYIGDGAFLESNLPGKVEIPPMIDCVKSTSFNCTAITQVICGDQVLMIERDAFGRNGELRYVELGKNIQFIGEKAFGDCPQIQTIVSFAKEPAKATGAFTGCDFERTVLEVPVGCVDAYRHADGWKDFHNITEHRELAIDISEIECLEQGVTREAIIRSEGAWKVTQCPSWVHVTPMESSSKDNLTITVDPQDFTAEGREGTIEFTLTGKKYTTQVKVNQTKADTAEDTEIVLQPASATGQEIPLMIVGEGFTASQIISGKYMQIMNETMEQFFDVEPYKSLRNHFTVLTAIACSPDEGVNDYYTKKQTKFGTYEVEPKVDKLRAYAEKVSPTHIKSRIKDAMVIVVNNYGAFNGWSTICEDGFTIASVGYLSDAVYPYDQRGLIQHHAGGAAFAGLGVEYVSHFDHIKSCKCGGCNSLGQFNNMKQRGYYANLSMSGKLNEAPWQDFIFHPTYSADVDMWEGGHRHLRGVWRSESQSVMGTYIRYFNTISRYTIYQGVMRRAGLPYSLEDFIANDKIEKP